MIDQQYADRLARASLQHHVWSAAMWQMGTSDAIQSAPSRGCGVQHLRCGRCRDPYDHAVTSLAHQLKDFTPPVGGFPVPSSRGLSKPIGRWLWATEAQGTLGM